MFLLEASLAAVIVLSALLLAVLGYARVSDEADAVIRVVRQVVGSLSASVTVEGSNASLEVIVRLPKSMEQAAGEWLIVADSDGAVVEPSAQVVRRSEIPLAKLVVRRGDKGAARVVLSVYDVATLAPVAQLTALVPADAMSVWARVKGRASA